MMASAAWCFVPPTPPHLGLYTDNGIIGRHCPDNQPKLLHVSTVQTIISVLFCSLAAPRLAVSFCKQRLHEKKKNPAAASNLDV